MAPGADNTTGGEAVAEPCGAGVEETTNLGRMAIILRSSAVLKGLFVLALAFTLYMAKSLFIPIFLAIFLSILFFPFVRRMARLGIPRPVTSGLIVAAMITLVGFGIVMLASPAEEWLREAPRSIRQIKTETLEAKDKLADIQALANEVDELTKVENTDRDVQQVVVERPSAIQSIIGSMPTLLAGSMVVVFLTFFILVAGDGLLLKMTRCGRTWAERRRIVTIARHIQAELSRYLATVTVINVALGLSTSLVLYLLEVPNAFMWGTMVAIFNFAPYVGALVSALVLLVVGLTTFGDLTEALTVPLSFLVLTILEGQVITPAIVGRNMTISAMMVLLSVIVWGWMWGIAGALMAVPILASFKSICDHCPGLQHIGSFLSSEGSQRTRPRNRHQPAERPLAGPDPTL